jgi:hypothetical protein
MTGEMTDAEVAAQVERTDRFIADFREMVAATAVDPVSPCAMITVAEFSGSRRRSMRCRS